MDREIEIGNLVQGRFAEVVEKLELAIGPDAALAILAEEVSSRLLGRGVSSFQLTGQEYLTEISVLPRAS